MPDYITPPVYSTNKYGYSTRPMTDTQAKDLLLRLSNVLKYRMNLSKKYTGRADGTRQWRENMVPNQREFYESKLTGLETSQANINKLASQANRNDYNIEAHEISVPVPEDDDPPVYPTGETNTGGQPDPVTSAKFIIKSIDGIAILNTILNINDIRNIYVGAPDGRKFANGLINDAFRASEKIDETYDGNKNYPWRNQKYNGKQYIRHYTDGGIVQECEYPHFTKDSSNKWYTFTGKFYKYVNTLGILHGSSGNPHYVSYMPNAFKTDAYGFKFDANFADITGHADQQQYIYDVLNTISNLDGNVSAEFVNYVKSFAIDYIKTNTKKPNNLYPVSSAFDYYLIDYLVQILEAEYELYVALLDNYRWATSSEIGANKSLESLQYNDAPFYYSSCNGASCVGLCYGSCVNTCNGCGGCTKFCTTSCGGTCIADCAKGCKTSCGDVCGSGCTSKCDNSCVAACKADCDTYCSKGCKDGCKTACVGNCSTNCTEGCNDGCKDGCKFQCQGECGYECGVSCGSSCRMDGSTAPTVAQQTPNVSHSSGGGGIVVVNEQGIGYFVAVNKPGSNGYTYVGDQSMNYSPDAVSFPNNNTTDRQYQQRYGSGSPQVSDYIAWQRSNQSNNADD